MMKLHIQFLLSTILLSFSLSTPPAAALPLCSDLRYPNILDHYSNATSDWDWLYASPLDILSSSIESFKSKFFEPKISTKYIYNGIESLYHLNQTSTELDSWLDLEKEVAFNGILSNIGGIGIHSDEVSHGAVIASPSKVKPNYFYQWVRDAAITINSLVQYLQDNYQSDPNSSLVNRLFYAIESYIANNYKLQRLDNKSGSWKSLEGLGEPKFMANSEPFNENWGRPQRDGPGLRIITIANYLDFLLEHNLKVKHPSLPDAKYIYNEIVKPDLKYIMENWYKNGFDLWEEINSMHLFTSLTMLKALKTGIKLADDFNDPEFKANLKLSFTTLRFYILFDSGFKLSEIPYLIETPSLFAQGKRCGLDIGSVLGSLMAHDMDDHTDFVDIPFPVDDSAVMSTLSALTNDMKYRYPINQQSDVLTEGFALGRYPEDVYDGYGISEGNPWFISTATASEVLFKLVYYLYYHNKDLVITNDQFTFYSAFINLNPHTDVDKIILPYKSDAFIQSTISLLRYADSFLEVIKNHVDAEGHMSEQFNRYNGYMEGAKDLTWSYGSFWSALRWREKASDIVSGLQTF